MKSLCTRRARASSMAAAAVLLAVAVSGCGPDGDPQTGLFTAWSPGGERLVVAPESAGAESGLWLCDAASGYQRKIVSLAEGQVCIHPQWSPFADEILFAVVPEDADGDPIPYSVWKVHPDGTGLAIMGEGTTPEGDDEAHPFLLPNAVMWGALPGTVVFQKAFGTCAVPMLFDPYTGSLQPFVPCAARAYSLQPSPCRRRAAAVLHDGDGRARVFVSDFGIRNWRLLACVQIDPDHLGSSSPVVFWSPDSTRFVIPETDGREHNLRVFDVDRGTSQAVAGAFVRGAVLWNPDGRSFVFSGALQKHEPAGAGIFRACADSQRVERMIEAENTSLLGWARAPDRLVFATEVHTEDDSVHRFFWCSPRGGGLVLLPVEPEDAASLSPDGATLALIRKPGRVRFVSLY